MSNPVVVIGGGLAGMAAAARLAKNGHPVELYEAAGQLGGRWAPTELSPGILVDAAPSVLGFPAPWRDLFRKSGRPLEAELGRMGYALEPADPTVYEFADGAELRLPSDRGDQFEALAAAYGNPVAARWRDLIDSLAELWQALRPLGLEAELHARDRWGRSTQLSRSVRRHLWSRRSLADLAGSAPHPHLTALVRSVAHRHGATPEATPAMVAVELWNTRTFGRWQIISSGGSTATGAGRSSVLTEALAARLKLRKVVVRLGVPVQGLHLEAGRVVAVLTANGSQPAAAVISTVDPWSSAHWLPAAGRAGRDLGTLSPALAPTIEHTLVGGPPGPMGEHIGLSAAGVPVISYRRPVGDRTLLTVHDFARPQRCAAYGVAWRGFGSWLPRPPISGAAPGLFTAGPWSAAGSAPSSQILSGALAAYACQDLLTGHSSPDRQ